MFVVICREDSDNGVKGHYVRAARLLFQQADHAGRYAATIALDREAQVLPLDEYLIKFEGWRRP